LPCPWREANGWESLWGQLRDKPRSTALEMVLAGSSHGQQNLVGLDLPARIPKNVRASLFIAGG